MSAETGSEGIYFPSPDPRFLTARLNPEQARLVLLAACERKIEANENQDPRTRAPDKVLETVSGYGIVEVEISQEVQGIDPLVSLLTIFGRQKAASALAQEAPNTSDEASSTRDAANALDAFALAEKLDMDRAALEEKVYGIRMHALFSEAA